jgi:hypothetical protein
VNLRVLVLELLHERLELRPLPRGRSELAPHPLVLRLQPLDLGLLRRCRGRARANTLRRARGSLRRAGWPRR